MKLSIDFFKNLPENEKKLTLSTKFTILRFLLIPLIIYCILNHNWKMAFWITLFSALSDVLDGQIARARNEKTILGACLDPLADKFLVVASYISLLFVTVPFFYIPEWFVFIVLLKELILILGAAIFCSIKGWIHVQPSILGKGAMVLHMFFLSLLFLCYTTNLKPFFLLSFIFDSVILLVLSSLVQYGTIVIKQFIFQKNL